MYGPFVVFLHLISFQSSLEMFQRGKKEEIPVKSFLLFFRKAVKFAEFLGTSAVICTRVGI